MTTALLTTERRGLSTVPAPIWTQRAQAQRAMRRLRRALPAATMVVLRIDDWPSYAVTVWTADDAFSVGDDDELAERLAATAQA